MNTRKKRKFKIHTGSVSEMAFKIAETPLKGQNKFLPERMQKTGNQSDCPRQRKRSKTGKILANSNFAIFLQFFLVFSAQSDRIHL